MVFAHISIEEWVIGPYVQSLFYCSHLVQVLPPNNVEVVNGNIVTSDVAMVIYVRGGFQMFLEPFTKSFLGTLQYIPHHNPPCHIGIYR